jgi:hypothetical protein
VCEDGTCIFILIYTHTHTGMERVEIILVYNYGTHNYFLDHTSKLCILCAVNAVRMTHPVYFEHINIKWFLLINLMNEVKNKHISTVPSPG